MKVLEIDVFNLNNRNVVKNIFSESFEFYLFAVITHTIFILD